MADGYVAVIRDLGVPVGILVVFMLAVWRLGAWVLPLLRQLAEAHINFLSSVSQYLEEYKQLAVRQTEILNGAMRSLEKLNVAHTLPDSPFATNRTNAALADVTVALEAIAQGDRDKAVHHCALARRVLTGRLEADD